MTDATAAHKRTDPPVNRHGQRLNDDYLSPHCGFGIPGGGCISNACCCACHQPGAETEAERLRKIIEEAQKAYHSSGEPSGEQVAWRMWEILEQSHTIPKGLANHG